MRRLRSPDAVVGVEMVEMVEATEPDDAPPDRTARSADAARRPARRRALRRLGIAVIAVLVLAAVVVNVADARRDAARREALADLGWVMPAMDGPLDEVWRAPGGSILTQADGVVVTRSDDSDTTLRAVETATGTVLWERENANEECWPVLDEAGQGPIPRLAVSRPEMLMCIPFDAFGSDGTPPAEGASIPVAFVDLGTGAVQGRVTVDGQLVGQAEAGGEMLLISRRVEGAVGVLRVDPRSGRVAWTWTSGPRVLPVQAPGSWTWSLDEDGDVLQIDGVRSVAVSVDDGAEAEPGPGPRGGTWTDTFRMASGQVVAAVHDLTTAGVRIDVLEADGTTRFEVDGSPWRIWFDDGSLPDSVVVQQEHVAGALVEDVALTSFDLDTGEERWSVPDSYSQPVFLLEGTAIVAAESTVGALDAVAGEWLWLHPAAGDMAFDPLTDGEVVLVPVSDGGRALAALDLRTGEERWRMPVPADAFGAHVAHDGTLLVTTGSEVVAYR